VKQWEDHCAEKRQWFKLERPVLAAPPLWLARVLLHGYVAQRRLHFAAYHGKRDHETRADYRYVGSSILIFMTCWVLAPLGS
jgi:hypothetical protein